VDYPILDIDMPTLDDLAKRIKDFEKESLKQGKKIAHIEGQLSAPKKPPHPYVVPLITFAGGAVLLFWGWISVTLVQHGNTLTGIRQSMLSLGITIAANAATAPQSQETAKTILTEAKKNSTPIPSPVVEQAGKKFIEAARADPKAWDVALQFVAYRSSLNSLYTPTGFQRKVNIKVPDSHYNVGSLPGKAEPALSVSRLGVSPERGARYENIGQNLNISLKESNNAWLYVKGGTVNIDYKDIRHATLQDVEVHYTGQPVILEDVIFINCTFVFDNNNSGRDLSQALLASEHINFRAQG
jgi:hypothetical protein